jgi:hypothetical protein
MLAHLKDRGGSDRAIIDLLECLAAQAHQVGGAVLSLLGNHEALNALGDFYYTTPAGTAAFADVAPPPAALGAANATLVAAGGGGGALPGRANAFRPGGLYARKLAGYQVTGPTGMRLPCEILH